MSLTDEQLRKKEKSARMMIWMASRSSRNKTFVDKICRFLISRATKVKPEDDFMRDELIDSDLGFDPDELDRFQRGE